MKEAQSWNELLAGIIRIPEERQRLAEALGVNQVTLTRWANGLAIPRVQHRRRLIDLVPAEYRESLKTMFVAEFAETFGNDSDWTESPGQDIPAEFYKDVLQEIATLPTPLHTWSLVNLILSQALRHLDPTRLGMCITVVQCMPPRGETMKVHSLRVIQTQGTPPWSTESVVSEFLGAESLAGLVVATCRPAVIQDLGIQESMVPGQKEGYEMSAAAWPILRASQVAGCVVFSSTQAHYFLPSRLALGGQYADLLSVAFKDTDFYPPSSIELRVLPPYSDLQKSYLISFQSRVVETLRQAAAQGQSMNRLQAEEAVWKQLEEEILN